MQKKKSYTVLEIRDKLANYCVYQDRCHQEVEKKLREYNLIPEAHDEILLYLLRENFLNEERFVKGFARGKFSQKKWGRIKIKIELKKRDINERLIVTALKEIDENEYWKVAEKLILKKYSTLSDTNHFVRNQKIIRYMLQKGYEYTIVKEILNDLDLFNQ